LFEPADAADHDNNVNPFTWLSLQRFGHGWNPPRESGRLSPMARSPKPWQRRKLKPLGRLEGKATPEHSCLPPEVRGTSMIPERERPWVTRWVPQMLAARRISANLTDSLSGAHPTTPDVPSPIEERSR
jgi:hypothetical protein